MINWKHALPSFLAGVLVIGLTSRVSQAGGSKEFYKSKSHAQSWVESHANDPRAKLISKIAEEPQAQWLTGPFTLHLMDDAENAERAEKTLVIVTYAIPGRDNGNYSAGGLDGPRAYEKWVAELQDYLVSVNALCIIEPDAIGLAPQLKEASKRDERYSMLSNSVVILKKNKKTKVYLAISGWLGLEGAAEGLKKSGIELADGFAYNISGYNDQKRCITFCDKLSKLINDKHYVIDTSRNGNGSWESDDKEKWCNPPGRALGIPPTFDTGLPLCDAFLWIKRPGESDGTCRGGPRAGTFWSDNAYELAKNAKW